MVRNKIKTYWLLLLILMYVASVTTSVGQTYAHYDTTVVANTVMAASPYGMTSNYLVKKGEPALTVLMGELSMEQSTKVAFWLKSCGTDAIGKLAWTVANPEHREYLQISMQTGPQPVVAEDNIELLRDVAMEFYMVLQPTSVARTTVHEMMKINILVTWGDEMWGTFQVILPEVKEEEPPSDPEDPENQEINQNEAAAAQNEMTSETIVTENEENGSDDHTTEETTQPTTDATTSSTEDQSAPIRMETISRFDLAEKLPVKIHLTNDITTVRLGMQVTEGEETRMEPLPDDTRFSLDRGENYYMMYDGYITEFSVNAMESLSLLLDFSGTDLQMDETLSLQMEAYSGEILQKTSTVSTVPDAKKSCLTLSHPLDQQTRKVAFAQGETREAAREVGTYGWGSRILSRDNALEFTLPMEWLDAEVEYSVDMLTMTENQTLEYKPVTLSSKGLQATYMDYDLTHNLVFRIGETMPQAGTYRLIMKWNYEGICFAETQTTFFINYSAHAVYPLGG